MPELSEQMIETISSSAKRMTHGRIVIEFHGPEQPVDVIVESRTRFGKGDPRRITPVGEPVSRQG